MRKILILFIALLPIFIGCNHTPTDPIIPPESIVVTTVSFLEIATTATTADIKSHVVTNGDVNISIEYGIGNYTNTTNTIPSSFSVSTAIGTKLTNLIPNTRYQFRVKAVTGKKSVVKYIADSNFVTNQLEVGDVYKDGIVTSVDQTGHGKYIKKITQIMTWLEAKTIAASMGGELPTVKQLLQLYPDKEKFGLDGIIYWSSEEDPTDSTAVKSVWFNLNTQPEANGQMVYSLKTMINNVLVICSF